MLLDYALIAGLGVAMYEGLNYIDNFKSNRRWNKLQEGINIKDYQLVKNEQRDYGSILTIKLPPGGTTTKLEDNIEAIEKAYKCKCLIKNIPFSNNVEVELITKEIKGLKQSLMLLNPYQLNFGYDLKGEPIIADMLSTPHLGVVGTSKMGKKELKMFIVYLIVCLVLIAITVRATNKNYKDIQKENEYLEECEKASIKIEKLEKRNIKAIHKLSVMNQK